MILGKKVLVIIPARSGSQRVKNKNLKLVNGKPLIYYTLQYAKSNLGSVDRIIVSTDSLKIQSYVNKFGDFCPYLRPKNLSKNNSSDLGFVKNSYEWLLNNMKFDPDIIVILRPTTPLRNKKLLINSVKTLIESKNTSIRTARCVGHNHPYWMYTKKKKLIKEIIPNKNIFKYYQSQMLPPIYKHDGYCDVLLKTNILKYSHFFKSLKGLYGKKMSFYIHNDPIFLNIDTSFDIILANLLLKKFKKNKYYV